MALTDDQRLQLAHALTGDPPIYLGTATMPIINRIAPLIEAWIEEALVNGAHIGRAMATNRKESEQ